MGNGDLKDIGDMLEPARTDPVHTLLVFLDLLKRDPQQLGKLRLAVARQAAHSSQANADILIDPVWFLHLCRP
jgi:hypothetical protein